MLPFLFGSQHKHVFTTHTNNKNAAVNNAPKPITLPYLPTSSFRTAKQYPDEGAPLLTSANLNIKFLSGLLSHQPEQPSKSSIAANALAIFT